MVWGFGSACAAARGCNGWGVHDRLRRQRCRPTTSSFDQAGVKVIVAAENLELIDGTEVDYIEKGRAQRSVQVPQSQRQRRVLAAASFSVYALAAAASASEFSQL